LFACLISFSNEITRICERVKGLDEEAVMRGLHSDRRLWSSGANGERLQPGLISYLRGGVGFGGSCFPKDVRALERFAKGLGLPCELIAAIRTINEGRAAEVVDLLEANLNASVSGLRIAVLGLAFKPDTDDTRESPGIRIAAELGRRGAHVIGHDPIVSGPLLARAGFPGLALASDLRSAMSGADGAIIATSWAEYRTADWPALTKAMARPLILDGRQVIPREQRSAGFAYVTTGMARAVVLN
jgi:UDPglucose 6-dehydrogenase